MRGEKKMEIFKVVCIELFVFFSEIGFCLIDYFGYVFKLY